ncbi:hypothetical protein ABMA27_003080 [Loxostege sticticalis]|uniref:Regulatory protein zeste n=1 Tax=Loxostege sticticalis TaxID=481309 RepID=A0ABR3HBL5_LOXSC
MPAHRLVSEQQQQMLLTAMEADRDLALARVVPAAGPMAKQAASRKWEALASRLNAVGEGCTKSATSWKKHWLNLKYITRKKVAEMGRHARGTGGGPPSKMRLTPVEERVLAILGEVSVHGHPEVRIPFSPQLEEADAAPEHDAPADAASTSESGTPTCLWVRYDLIIIIIKPYLFHCTPPSSVPEPRFQADVPQWAIRMEERHLEFEERSARALEDINRTQHEIRDLLRTLLEVVQERLPRFDLF